MKVVLADDSELILERLTDMLNIYGQSTIVGKFDNGTDAFNSIIDQSPDLAILDIKMPGMSGLEVAAEVRKKNKDIKIVILTFYTSEYYRMMASRAGADYFFNKVDDFEEVSMVIAGLLWKKANDKQHRGLSTES